VLFLADRPAAAAAAQLDPLRSPPDELAVGGKEIHLHCPTGRDFVLRVTPPTFWPRGQEGRLRSAMT